MSPSPQEKILILSSDMQIAYLLERVLRSAGYQTVTAQDRLSAETLFAQAIPLVTIVSEKLADGDGLELAKKLLEERPAMPVLLFVSIDNSDLLKRAMRMGISDYLALPLRTEDVLHSIENSLAISRRRSDWVAQETRRASSQLQRRIDEVETIGRVGRSIIASLDIDSVLSSIVQAATELAGAEEGTLLLVDEISGDLYMRASRNFNEEFARTFRLPVNDSLAGSVIQTGQPMVLDEQTPQKIKTSYLVQNLLYVPLLDHGKAIGVLGVDNRQSREPFTQTQIQAISALADYAVIALENANLFNRVEAERCKLETTLANIRDGVMIVDDGSRILFANGAFLSALGMDGQNVIGSLARNVVNNADLLEMLQDNNPASSRREVTADDGRIFSAQANLIPEVGAAITLHDITNLKKLDRIKSEFVSTVSHDLRSPLTAIMGYVDLLDRVGPVNETQKEFMRRIHVSVQNITSLVDDLLNLGRIEAGFDSRREALQLAQVVRYSVEGLQPRAEDKGQSIEMELPEQLPPFYGNPVQIRQMIDNLVENSIKYTPSGGKISVMGRQDGDQILIQVKDSGMGIPAIDLPYIFDKFYRASNASTEASGTGLGLAIVKSIVENHRGRIWVDSTVGSGSTFTVVLPITAM